MAFLTPGEAARLIVTAPDLSGNRMPVMAEAAGDTVQPAQKRPLQAEEIARRLKKTGDSLFEFEDLDVETAGDVFLPVASLNSLRREAVRKLEEAILERAEEDAAAAGKGSCAGQAENVPPAGEGRVDDRLSESCTKRPQPVQGGEKNALPAVWAQVTTAAQLRAARQCGIENIIAEETPQIM